MTDDNMETVDASNLWQGFECQDCKHVTRHPIMLRSIPRCEKCGGPTRGQGLKIRTRNNAKS